MHPLTNHFSSPIEREYEAWIVQGIEQYFKELEIGATVWAVSPSNEVNWPADEQILVRKRIIGLQMKKVTYKPLKEHDIDFGRLFWSFHNPKSQYDLVLKFPEIYYCLPTFINREYKRLALNHCLFWRPEVGSKKYKNAWYDNDKATKSHTPIVNAPRWGLFMEQVLDGAVGRRFSTDEDAKNYIDSIRRYMVNPPQDDDPVDDDKPSEPKKTEQEHVNTEEKEPPKSSSKSDDRDSAIEIVDESKGHSVYMIAVSDD